MNRRKLLSNIHLMLLALFGALAVSCSPPAGQSLFASRCENGNPNCVNSSIEISTSGASTDLAPTQLAADGITGDVSMKAAHYGDTVKVIYTIKNLRLIPLFPTTITMSPGGSSYVFDSSSTESCQNKTALLYNQTCTFIVSFTPGTIPPDQNLAIAFRSLTLSDLNFYSNIKSASILPDFTIDAAALSFPDTLTYAVSSAGYFESDLTVTNHSTTDITNIRLSSETSDSFQIISGGASYCSDDQTLAMNGGSCLVKIRFKPLTAGLKTFSLTFSGVNSVLGTVVRTHTVRALAKQISSSVPSYSFGTKLTSGSLIGSMIQISNPIANLNPAATSCTYGLSGSSEISISANSCGTSITSGTSCDLNLNYLPSTSAAMHNAVLDIACDDRGSSLSIPISARSIDNPLLVDPATYNFGDVLIGTTTLGTLTFSNEGTLGTLTNFTRVLSPLSGGSFLVASSSCTNSLLASATCEFVVQFSPSNTGPATAELIASSSEATLSNSILFQGRGLSILASDSLADHGSVIIGQDTVGPIIYITNPSTYQTASDCVWSAGSSVSQGFVETVANTCTTKTSLAPGESCIVQNRFTGAGNLGPRSSTVSLACTTGGTASIDLRGTVVADLRLVVVPPTILSYSSPRLVGISVDHIFYFQNADSTNPATSLSITLPGLASPWTRVSQGAADCASFTDLNPGQTCQVNLRYNPDATLGSEQIGTTGGTLMVSAAGGAIDPVDPTYSAIATKITASVGSFAFGQVTASTSHLSQRFTINNPSTLDSATGCSLSLSAPFNLVDNSCITTLANGSSCSFLVALPSQGTSANFVGTARMDCTIGGRAEIAITASPQLAPTLTWSGASYNFGYVDIGTNATLSFTLSHPGAPLDAPATGIALGFVAGSSANYTLLSTTCGTLLSPGTNCSATVKLTPTSTGTLGAVLSAAATETSATHALTGFGVDPNSRISLSTGTITLTNRLVGKSIDSDITLTNNAPSGAATSLSIGSPSSGAPWTTTVSGTPCGASLNLGSPCVVRLNYSPLSTGVTNGTLAITAANAGGAKTIFYSGTASKISPSSGTLDFGTVDFAATQTHGTVVTITNPSTLDGASGCVLSAQAPFTIVSSTCGATLAASGTCTFQVQITAPSTVQSLNKTASMTCTVGGIADVALVANILDIPTLQWQAAPSAAFGNQDYDAGGITRTYTLTNLDISSVQLSALGFSTSSPGFTIVAAGSTCSASTTLNPTGTAGDSCVLNVKFDPLTDTTATGGEAAVVRAQGTVPVAYQFDLSLTGTGTTMVLNLSTGTLNFTTRETNQSGSETLTSTLTNNGTRTANLSYSAPADSHFTYVGNCGASLGVGASCSLSYSFTAAATATTHSDSVVVTESIHSATLHLAATTIPAAILQGKDDRANTSYVVTVGTTDITGATDNANNIIDLSPTYRDANYTLKNVGATNATLNSMTVNLNYSSGSAGKMSVVNNTCTSDLIGDGTCDFTVRYTPTSNNETSTYAISVTGISAISAGTSTFAATSVIGHSIRGANLTLDTGTMSLGPLISTGTTTSATVTMTNNGDQTATMLGYTFVGGDATNFVKKGTSTCGSSLAGGATCTLISTFTPAGTVGYVSTTWQIRGAQTGDTVDLPVQGATYREGTITNTDSTGIEADLVADANRFYTVSRVTTDYVNYAPLLTVCSKTVKGTLDYTACTSTNIATLLGAAANSNSAGDMAGGGPRITVHQNKILIALQNEDLGFSGALNGNNTVIICQKPTSGNSVTNCAKFVVNTESTSGQFPNIYATDTQVIFANTGSSNRLLLTACTYDSASATTDNSTLTVGSCVVEDFATTDYGWYPKLTFNETSSQVVIATHEKNSAPLPGGADSLRLNACTLNGDNTFSNCTSTAVDSSYSGTQESGAYPDILISGSKLFSVYQLGESSNMEMKLISCTIDGSNVISGCSTPEILNNTNYGSIGTLANPRIGLSGSGTSGQLWIAGTTFKDPLDNVSDSFLRVFTCSVPISAGACSNLTPYYSQTPYVGGLTSFFSRSIYLDTTNKVLVVPYGNTDSNSMVPMDRLGILNLGLIQ